MHYTGYCTASISIGGFDPTHIELKLSVGVQPHPWSWPCMMSSSRSWRKSSGPLSKHIAIGPDGRPYERRFTLSECGKAMPNVLSPIPRGSFAEIVGHLYQPASARTRLPARRHAGQRPARHQSGARAAPKMRSLATRDFIFYRKGVPAWGAH